MNSWDNRILYKGCRTKVRLFIVLKLLSSQTYVLNPLYGPENQKKKHIQSIALNCVAAQYIKLPLHEKLPHGHINNHLHGARRKCEIW